MNRCLRCGSTFQGNGCPVCGEPLGAGNAEPHGGSTTPQRGWSPRPQSEDYYWSRPDNESTERLGPTPYPNAPQQPGGGDPTQHADPGQYGNRQQYQHRAPAHEYVTQPPQPAPRGKKPAILIGVAVVCVVLLVAAAFVAGNWRGSAVGAPAVSPSVAIPATSGAAAPEASVTEAAAQSAMPAQTVEEASAQPTPSGSAQPTSVGPQTSSATPTSAAAPTRPAPPVEPRFEQFYPLGYGDYGYVVDALQRMLTWRGVRTYVDGDFGSATERSVRQWQAQNGLSVTGIVDDTTWSSLLPRLQKGSSGDSVVALQYLLSIWGYDVVIDGHFGTQTESAVRAFQADRGLVADGIVGTKTWSSILS